MKDEKESLREMTQRICETMNNIIKLSGAPWYKRILFRVQLFIMRVLVGK